MDWRFRQLCFVCDDLEAYASLLQSLATSPLIFESQKLQWTVKSPDLRKFLKSGFPGSRDGWAGMMREIVLALHAAFPPQFANPRQAAVPNSNSQYIQIYQEAKRRRDLGVVKFSAILRPSEQLPMGPMEIKKILEERYLPAVINAAGGEDQVPDELKYARALIEGQAQNYSTRRRRLALKLSITDITDSKNTLRFWESAICVEQLSIPDDAIVLPVTLDEEDYIYLLALACEEIARTTPGVRWALFTRDIL